MSGMSTITGQGINAAFDLNSAASAFSAGLIKDKVQQLSQECDEDLDRNYVLQIRSLLREVDRKRIKFNDTKQRLLQNLQATLTSLQLNAGAIDDAVGEIDAMTPTWLGVIPSAATLAIRPPTPVESPPQSALTNISSPSLSIISSTNSTVLGDSTATVPPTAGPAKEPTTVEKQASQPPTVSTTHAKKTTAKDVEVKKADKHPREVAGSDDSASKKLKTDDKKYATPQQHTLRMADLDATECVFRHSKQQGFYVIRCESPECAMRIFGSAPFTNNWAFNHFNAFHFKQCKPESFIFENHSHRIEDATEAQVATRYKDGRIPECTPNTELPKVKGLKIEPATQDVARKESVVSEGTISMPNMPAKTTDEDDDDDEGDEEESEEDQPHRNLRQKPKTSYLDMIRGRNRSSMPPVERETSTPKTSAQPKRSVDIGSRINDESKAKANKGSSPGTNTGKPKSTDNRKPFGHTGEWPRRSAPH